MKYFTTEWWQAGCIDDSIFEKYQMYYSSIEHKLPNKIKALEDGYTLHDSSIKNIVINFETKDVDIKVLGYDIDLNRSVYYNLKFKGVTNFTQNFPQEKFVESELGDIGYWEYELLNNNIVQMNILFASEAEFCIIFKDFDFNFLIVDIPD